MGHFSGLGVVVNAYNYFFSSRTGSFDSDLFPVADRSLLFMLLLCTQPKQVGERREVWGSAYRLAIACLRDHNGNLRTQRRQTLNVKIALVLASDLEGRDQKMHLISFKGLLEIFCR